MSADSRPVFHARRHGPSRRRRAVGGRHACPPRPRRSCHSGRERARAPGHPQRVYTTDTYNSLTLNGPVNAHAIIDITPTYEQKRRALAAHAGTQPIEEHFGPMADNLSRLWGARIGVPRAEAFMPIPVLGRLPGMLRL